MSLQKLIAASSATSPAVVRWCQTRTMSTTGLRSARLLDSSTSINPQYANRPAPSPPVYPSFKPKPRVARSPAVSTPASPARTTSPSSKAPVVEAPSAADLKVELQEFLLKALRNPFVVEGNALNVPSLLKLCEEKEGNVSSHALPYESRPAPHRRVSVTPGEQPLNSESKEQDGIVTVAHVIGGDNPRVATHSGFSIDTATGGAATILTCMHTLQEFGLHVNQARTPSSRSPPSATFIITSSGHIFPIVDVVSALVGADIAILSLSPEPLRDPSYALRNAGQHATSHAVPKLRTLPVSPYPALVGSHIASYAYQSPMQPTKLKSHEWLHHRLSEYKDSIGRSAVTGSYDELAEMFFTSPPAPGSSGGPIIDVASGCVVGVVRGTVNRYGDRGTQGFGTPSEKIFELFALPGFERKSRSTATKASLSAGENSSDGGK